MSARRRNFTLHGVLMHVDQVGDFFTKYRHVEYVASVRSKAFLDVHDTLKCRSQTVFLLLDGLQPRWWSFSAAEHMPKKRWKKKCLRRPLKTRRSWREDERWQNTFPNYIIRRDPSKRDSSNNNTSIDKTNSNKCITKSKAIAAI